MHNAVRFLILLGAGTLVLAGCGRQQAPPARPAPPTIPQVEGRALSPADYVATASSIDQLVIQASQLAQTRAARGSVRELAARLLADHHGVGAQLSFAGVFDHPLHCLLASPAMMMDARVDDDARCPEQL